MTMMDDEVEIRFILTRTTTEEFQYDPDELARRYAHLFAEWAKKEIADRKRYGHDPFTDQELWESFVIELFEQHSGSTFGEELFGGTDEDYSIALTTRRDDE